MNIRLVHRADGRRSAMGENLHAPQRPAAIPETAAFEAGHMIADRPFLPLDAVNIIAQRIPTGIESGLRAGTGGNEGLGLVEMDRHLRSEDSGGLVKGKIVEVVT